MVSTTRLRTSKRLLRTSIVGACAALVGLSVCGCSHTPPDARPEGALRLFLDDLEASEDDGREMRSAYELLGPAARANLAERAHRVTEGSPTLGRQVEPWQMLASGHLGLAFRPKSMRASIVGDRATVEVVGADPQTERASIVCVHEGEVWKIEPILPEP